VIRAVAGAAAILACCASTALAGGAAAGPPVIHEPFTVLPCPAHPKTTLDLEGCAEKAILKSDKAIDARVKSIWGVLVAGKARTSFAAGEKSWLAYRRSSCSAEASKYAGGTLEPVAFANCEVARNKTHLADLASMLVTLRQH
jgi:uncharacterized protein YecT (DUF1311 family)